MNSLRALSAARALSPIPGSRHSSPGCRPTKVQDPAKGEPSILVQGVEPLGEPHFHRVQYRSDCKKGKAIPGDCFRHLISLHVQGQHPEPLA